MNVPLWRRAASFGTGVGVRIGEQDLEVAVVRVRPTGARPLGTHRVTAFRDRPAAEWGAEVLTFLKQFGAEKQAAVAVLPRREAILRLLTLPNLNEEDTAAAVRFQLDTLHPYGEDEVASGWARLNQAQVAVGIAGQRVVDQYATIFSEAGLRLAGISFSGAVLHAALRVAGAPGAAVLAAWPGEDQTWDFYGESEARPLFSAGFDMPEERAAALVRAELRAGEDVECRSLESLLPWPPPAGSEEVDGSDAQPAADHLAQTAALAAACPHLAEPLNLLPEAQRAVSSRARYIPTLILAVVAGLTGTAVLAQEAWLDRAYLARLQEEIKKAEPAVARVQALDAETAELAERIRLLDEFRRQSRADLDVLKEVNRLLPPPGWVQQLQVTRDTVQVGGEAPEAEGLLKKFDESPAFRGAAFTMPLTRSANGEMFRLRAQREGMPQ
ncbi:MAG: hypothetical protein KJZ84_07875 [Bryobacteraceae bacterium]|nr:hypothetical protein [Bryobacteraceae bacterium]